MLIAGCAVLGLRRLTILGSLLPSESVGVPSLNSSDSPPPPRLLLFSLFRCLTRPQSQEATRQVSSSQSRVVSLAPTSRMCGFSTRQSRSPLTPRSTWTGASAASRQRAPIIFQCDGEFAHDVIVLFFPRLESGVAAMRAGMVRCTAMWQATCTCVHT
jgi:hypothetical protein